MGQYKVPQNVEAEDKILGPLTFRQFIYGLIGFGWGALCFYVFKDIPAVMIIVGFPPTLFFMLLAFYTRDGQNFESLFIAMVGFFAAPHMRIWVKENVTETFHIEHAAPKQEVTQRNPEAVKSELEKLSHLVDSRGWNRRPDPLSNGLIRPTTTASQRIAPPPDPTSPSGIPRTDMLDPTGSATAKNVTSLLNQAAADARQQAIDNMGAAAPKSAAALRSSTSVVTPQAGNDILKLATLNDLTVAQLANQANRLAPNAPLVNQQGSAA